MMDAVTGGKALSAREEELLGLLAGFPDGDYYGSDRELSFSDFVEAGGTRPSGGAADDHTPREEEDRLGKLSSLPRKPQEAAASKQKQREQATATARDKRQRRQRSGGGRGSCGGGDDGVLLNLYVPGLLTRSMTAPRPGRGALPPPCSRAGQGAPAKAAAVAAGKARAQAPLGIGCWPALWGRGRDRRSRTAAKACS